MASTYCLNRVWVKSKKYIKMMKRHLHAQVQAKFDLYIAKIISTVNLTTEKADKHLPSSSIS
eukprot:4828838-Ditylum_brightwellii.AAC.1